MRKLIMLTVGMLAMLLASLPAVADYYVPMPVYRTGPYAAGGTGYFGGIIDYYKLLNERDGGIGGVKVVWDECETEYNRTKGIECYHRQKKGELGQALYFDPLSVGISSSLIEQGRKDQISIISVNHGRTETERGDVFPYQFPLGTNAYDFAYATVKYMAEQLGGMDKLKGETMVTLFHGSPYGREANEFLTSLSGQYGFTHEPIEVPHPGNEQGSQWLKIRRMQPALVFLRGWGVMNPVAMQTAVRNGYPVSQLVGNEWSNSDEDVIPAGKAADGYVAVTVHRAGKDYPLMDEIEEMLYTTGKGDLEDPTRLGSVYYNLGIWAAAMSAEAIRVAQERFGKELTSAQVRWGFENIKMTKKSIEEMGLGDIVPPIEVSCMDHAAVHIARFQKWDANKRQWSLVSDWIEGRSDFSQNVVDTNAQKYAEEHPEFPQRDCNNPKDRDDFDV